MLALLRNLVQYGAGDGATEGEDGGGVLGGEGIGDAWGEVFVARAVEYVVHDRIVAAGKLGADSADVAWFGAAQERGEVGCWPGQAGERSGDGLI